MLPPTLPPASSPHPNPPMRPPGPDGMAGGHIMSGDPVMNPKANSLVAASRWWRSRSRALASRRPTNAAWAARRAAWNAWGCQ